MLRELVDAALLEDFASGLARASGLHVSLYDPRGVLIAEGGETSTYAALVGRPTDRLPAQLEYLRLPADEPPAQIALHQFHGGVDVVAPVFVDQSTAGFVSLGEMRLSGAEPPRERWAERADAVAIHSAYLTLPVLEPSADGRPIRLVRWAARLLTDWCRRQSRFVHATEELSLMGDIAAMLTGDQSLQIVLDRIVAQTAQVMRCRFCSLRLYNPQTRRLQIAATHSLSEMYRSRRRILRDDSPIDHEALEGQLVYVENAQTDPRMRDPESLKREGIVSILTAGMLYRGRPIGVMRVYADHVRRFRGPQRELLKAVASQAAVAIVNARLLDERLRAAETERELRLAGTVQQRMFSTSPPRHPLIQMSRVFSASRLVSGDFCDFVSWCDGRPAAIVADVVGKGVPAALLGASVRGAMHASVESCVQLSQLFARLNRHVCRETTPSEFVTMVVAAVTLDGRRLEWCSAGHEPLLLLRGGAVRVVDEGDLVLGLDPDVEYHAHTLDLEPGDFVLFYSDGAIDAASFQGELFGRQRLHEALQKHGHLEPEAALQGVMWEIRRFVGLSEQADDITLVGVRIVPDGE